MKILIMTDSRGGLPPKNTWVTRLVSKNNSYDITFKIHKTILEQHKYVINEKLHYDFIILQTGNHEYVKLWPRNVLEDKVKDFDPNYKENVVRCRGNFCRYRNDILVRRLINNMKKYTNNMLLIGMHTNRMENEEAAYMMNNIYDFNVDYMNLPVHLDWREVSCYDYIHYSAKGADFIFNYVDRYIKRANRNMADILNTAAT